MPRKSKLAETVASIPAEILYQIVREGRGAARDLEAPSADLARSALETFERSDCGQRFSTIVALIRLTHKHPDTLGP